MTLRPLQQSRDWSIAPFRRFVGRFRQRPEVAAVVQNSAWLLVDKGVRLLFGVLVGAWVARYLGPERFGEFSYVLAYFAIWQAAASLGLDGIVVRDLATGGERATQVLGTVLALRCLAGGVLYIAAIASLYSFTREWDGRTQLAALAGGSTVFLASNTLDLWFQSKSQSRRTVAAKLLSYVVANGMKIVLILRGGSAQVFALMVTVESALYSIGLGVMYRWSGGPRLWEFSGSDARRLLHEGAPLLLSSVSIATYMRADQVMIEWLLGEQELGIYAAVVSLATAWHFVPMTLSISLAPLVAKKKAEGEDAYWAALGKVFRLFAVLGWATSLGLAVLSPVLVHVLFGPRYSQGVGVLAVYSFTNLFINLGVAQGLWAINEKRSGSFLQKTLAGVAVCVVGNLLLIPRMGIMGVAIVAVISQLVSAVLSNFFICREVLRQQLVALFPFVRDVMAARESRGEG